MERLTELRCPNCDARYIDNDLRLVETVLVTRLIFIEDDGSASYSSDASTHYDCNKFVAFECGRCDNDIPEAHTTIIHQAIGDQ